ncbi:uncharacterized protein CcaverHIS019_0406710 [Cutaneotrichosporon cavernicola]|uniref:Uncharacterized protein n=1 Tax=Cutaneotrichosporon cavernicola TaxID=279322 RepID=A0AA48L4J8_9TREE|nr:uncharacterized protein CcaverHIS019_0406710 [Cutaneotrichosporon cavernicola]BEI91851.1 hypothetical protein CcaverHIS019_0406710 [Cutaneotrichosporon cavernicola]BEJ07399.1 hypothetical protein CcaverHIS641_0406680 [Cutaneotrichosporon cavernicola]
MSVRLLPSLRGTLRSPILRAPALAHAYSTPSTPSPATRDPAHPHLYYHPYAQRIALSFLPNPPPTKSSTVIGSLPATPEAGLSDFEENPAFRIVLHAAIKDGLEKGADERIMYEAEMRPGDGYMTLTDERAVPPQGRIGETEDLIGSVFVKDGKIVASTYEPFPSYRLVTSNGVLTLSDGLDKHVLAFLEKMDVEEQAEQRADEGKEAKEAK